MAYTVAEALSQARQLLNDNNATIGYRKTDAEYIGKLNEGLAALSLVRPELFQTVTPHVAAVGAYQRFASAVKAIKFQGCDRNAAGTVMTKFDKDALDHYDPAWTQGTTSANPRSWCEHETIPDAFWVHPPATVGVTIYARVIAAPAILPTNTTATALPTPDSYLPALVDYIVYRESASDDENLVQQRAVAFFQQYLAEGGTASVAPVPGR